MVNKEKTESIISKLEKGNKIVIPTEWMDDINYYRIAQVVSYQTHKHEHGLICVPAE